MSEFKTSKFFLHGKLQAETALAALMITGADPDAEKQLRASLISHNDMGDNETQVKHCIVAPANEMPHLVDNIEGSLQVMELASDTSGEDRIAADTLLGIIASQRK